MLLARVLPEADEHRRHDIGHAPRELEGIALRSADHSFESEQRRNDVNNTHG
jgi:hypothetical protein